MSVDRVDAFPTPSVELADGVTRLARWFSPQGFWARAERREQDAERALHIGDLKWQWRQACELTGLGRLVFTPSGPTVAIPLIGRITLGTPISFTVQRRPGQLLADFEAAGPRIAAAMGAAAIRVRPLAGEWIVIELVNGPPQPPAPAIPFPTRRIEHLRSAA